MTTATTQQMVAKLADQYYEMNLNPPAQEPTINDFVPRYRQYKTGQDNLEAFIKDLMIHCENIENKYKYDVDLLAQQLRNTALDYEDAVNSRREHQARIKELENQLNFLSQDNTVLKHRNPYVLVLIDGDGLIFRDDLARQGLDGGKKAAYVLRQAVANHFTNTNDMEIVVKVVANLGGLSRAMKRAGSIDNEDDLREFMIGFTQARASFDFVDVGYGKERVDSKIQETARFHLRNYNCKQILLGVSHDAGYAPFLDSVLHDDSARTRVTVLEGFPTSREIVNTNVDIVSFEHVFRSDKLVDRTSPNSLSSTPRSGAAVLSYATITQKASPPPQIILPLGPKTTAKTTTVRPIARPTAPLWNPGARGLDPVIPLNQSVLDQVKKRKDSDKLCNNHYLRGPCTKGDDCCFEHHYKPNQDEIRAIQFLARLNPCTSGQDCEVENCIYGHHCPSVKDGVCTHPFCKFQVHEHPPGTRLTKHNKRGGAVAGSHDA